METPLQYGNPLEKICRHKKPLNLKKTAYSHAALNEAIKKHIVTLFPRSRDTRNASRPTQHFRYYSPNTNTIDPNSQSQMH